MKSSSELAPLLEIGDRAVGVPVLSGLYARMKNRPESIDLDALWQRLGIERRGRTVRFADDARDSAIRRAITAPVQR